MTTATKPTTTRFYCELHGLGYGCALCNGTNRDLTGEIGALYSGAYGVSGAPSSGYPDHTKAPAGSVIDPTYVSRITWVDGEIVVSGSKPTDDARSPVYGANAAPSDAEWCEQAPTKVTARATLYGPAYWSLRKLDFDVLGYLDAVAAGRLQWRPDPYLAEGWTFEQGIVDAWPGETTIPAPSPQERKRLRDGAPFRAGYRSERRQQALTS